MQFFISTMKIFSVPKLMGITGLLPIVKGIMKKKHIGKYSHTKIGIDGHAWLHQVLPAIAYEIYSGIEATRHVNIFMSKIKELLDFNITPIFVFDGDYLSSKEKTQRERELLRKKAKAEVEFYLKQNEMGKARELMKRCVSVTPEILQSVLNLLKSKNIEYIVSPYEADAQLFFLQKIGYIDYILTEDSDLIVYGSKNILYKYNGTYVEEFDVNELHKAKDAHFKENLLDICILSGCDYVDSIKGVGLITAHKILKERGTVDSFIDHMISINKQVPENYLIEYNKAKLTFLHHIVYNPVTLKRQFLVEPTVSCDFLGSLENLPIRFKCPFRSEIQIDRHYKPIKMTNLSAKSTDIETATIDSYEIDMQLSLPYFK